LLNNIQAQTQWIWQEFEQISGPQMHEILMLRQDVFIVEQQCLYADADGLDSSSLHLSGRDVTGEIVAYARLCLPGSRYAEPSIGRLLTIKGRRGSGLARHAVELCIEKAATAWQSNWVRISAQLYLRDFYVGLGFTEISEIYDEDGIKHVDMMLDLKT
jgi:ElaA protein